MRSGLLLALACGLAVTLHAGPQPAMTVVTNRGFCANGVYPLTTWQGGVRLTGLTLWGSFCDLKNDNVGRIEFTPFPAPASLNLYLAGYPGQPGRRLLLSNVQTKEEQELKPPSPPAETWRFETLPVPAGWVGKPVQLIAEDTATGLSGWLGFSLPILTATPPASSSALLIDTTTAPTGFCRDGVYMTTKWPRDRRPPVETWGSFCGQQDAGTGWAASSPVSAGSEISFYIAGYPDTPGLLLALENLQSGEQVQLKVPEFPAEAWQLRHFPVPAQWKGQPVRIIGQDRANRSRGWMAFSSPVTADMTMSETGAISDKVAGLAVLLLALLIGGAVAAYFWLAPSPGAIFEWFHRPRTSPQASRRRLVVLSLTWMLAIVAILPAIFQWPAPHPATGPGLYFVMGIGYLVAAVICYAIYRTEAKRLTGSQAIVLVFLVFLLTNVVNDVHWFNVDQATRMFPMANRDWQEGMHNAVMRLEPDALPHSYRFLPNSIVRWMQLAGLDFDSARNLYRLLTGLVLFYAVYKYARLFCSFNAALIALLLSAAIFPVSFEYYAGQLTDPLSHLSFMLALIFLETEEFALLVTTLVIGSLAKETVLALAGYYVLFCRKEKNYPLKALTLCLATVGAYFGVRLFVLHGAMSYKQTSGVGPEHILKNLTSRDWPVIFLLTACALLPFLVLGWKDTPLSLKRQILYLFPVLFFSGLFFSWLYETRNFMPLVFVMSVVAGSYLVRLDPSALPENVRPADRKPLSPA